MTLTGSPSGLDATVGPGLLLRAGFGGVLMGLANLVPGISGGTMLLAVGIYPVFIAAVADATLLRLNKRTILVLGTVGGCAALAILLLAGTIQGWVISYRWIMYSLFIGLTLGGVPLVWRLARPANGSVWRGALGGFVAMVAMALSSGAMGGGGGNPILLFLAGLGGASAMILPGISGGYLLLVLGQYETILGAIDDLKTGLLGDSDLGIEPSFSAALSSMDVVIPVGIGVLAGVVGVSNLLKWLLKRYEKATLGVLLGLLLGAVVGLWPFQVGEAPQPGDSVKGQTLTAETVVDVDPEDWPVRFFRPTAAQAGMALLLVGLGYGATRAIDRLGGSSRSHEA